MRPVHTRGFAVAIATVTLAILNGAGASLSASERTNNAPIAHAQNRHVLEGAPTAILLAGSDAERDPLSFAIAGTPAHGTLSGTAPNVVYTPNPNYNGPDSFSFTVNDGSADSNVATVTLTVVPALWTSAGLYGGAIELLRTDPLLPDVVYAGTSSGLFKSTDGALTWIAAGAGLPFSSGGIRALAIDPSDTATLYASVNASGLYKSVDRGASWVQLPLAPFPQNVDGVAVDPANPSTVYAAVTAILSPASVYKSTDGGTTWNSGTATGIVAPTALLIDPAAPATLYLAGSNGVAKSIDGGGSWTAANTGLTNTNVLSLVVDPASPATLFASTNNSVFKSTNGAASWDPTSAPLGGRLAMDEASPSTLYLGTLGSGVYETNDGGDTWQPANAAITSATIYAIAVGRGTPASIYASPGQIDIGVFKSTDGASTWAPGGITGLGNAAAAGLVNQRPENQPSTALIASGNGRLLKRLYADSVWTNLNATGPIPSQLFQAPSDSSIFYGLSNSGGVVKSTDGAVTWSSASNGLPAGTPVSTLTVDRWQSGTVYAGVSGGSFSNGTIYKTTNGGGIWSPSGTGLPTPAFPEPQLTITSIIVAIMTPDRVYAGTNYGVYVSTDAGASWSPAGAGSMTSDVRVLAFDPFTSTTIYAGTGGGVYKSVDAGASWTPASNGLSESVNMIVAYGGGAPSSVLYAGTQTGVYRTLNGGLSWIKITAGLLDPVIFAMTVDDATGRVFAATRTGVFELQYVPWGTPAVLFASPADITYGTPLGGVQLNASALMPGTFTYTPAAGTILDVGNAQTLSVRFSPADAAHFRDGTADAFINVLPANSTTTLYAFPTNASFLQPVYLVAVVQPVAPATGIVGGTVEFFDGATSLGTAALNASGYAVLPANGLASGTHFTTASYLGSSRYNTSTSDPVGVSVESLAESTFTLLVPVTNPQAAGQQTVLVAAVIALDGTGAPTGTVQFLDGNTVIGSAPINSSGLAIFTTSALAAGPHLVGARYMGDGTFTASTAPPAVQTIYTGTRPAATTTTVGFSAPSSVAGEPVTITATVTSAGAAPNGPVIFFGDGLLLGVAPVANVGGAFRASLVLSTLPVGIHVITASYIGGTGTAASNSLPGVHVVQAPTLSIASSPGSGSLSLQLLMKALQLAKGAVAVKR